MAMAIRALQDKIEITASRCCFTALRNKAFIITPDCLMRVLNKELTATARTIYLQLYSDAEKAFNSRGVVSPVIISARTLAENYIFKSERTIRRRLAELAAKGFIKIQHRFNTITREQDSSAIYPVIPNRLIQELLAAPNRRASNKIKRLATIRDFGVSSRPCEKNTEHTLNEAYFNNSQALPDQPNTRGLPLGFVSDNKRSLVNDLVVAHNAPEQQAYNYYTKLVLTLQEEDKSLSELRANMRAYNQLSPEQRLLLAKHLEQQIAREQLAAVSERFSAPLHAKNGRHKIYNNCYINSNAIVDNLGANNQAQAIIVNIDKKITAEFIRQEIKKFIANNKIPENIYRNGKTVEDLIIEVQYHVALRDVTRTQSKLHALNAAKNMIKTGVWLTPKKYAYRKNQEAIAREQAAVREKRQELADIRQLINN